MYVPPIKSKKITTKKPRQNKILETITKNREVHWKKERVNATRCCV